MEIFKEIIMPVIEVVFPMIIAFIGWIVVHNLNKKNMKEEKRLVLKSEAYKELKEKHEKIFKSGIKFINFLNSTVSQLKNYKSSVYESNPDRDNLIENHHEEKFKFLMDEYGDVFVEFTSEWERNAIIFKPLVKKRYALQIEKKELEKKQKEIFSKYILFFNDNIYNKSEENIEKLREDINLLSEKLLDFMYCMEDVNKDLQDFVYGDLFEENIKRRIMSEKTSSTIDDLLKKHKKEIEKNYVK